MTRSPLVHWRLGTGLGSAVAVAISPAAHAATVTGGLQMRIQIQKSCTITVGTDPKAASDTVDVHCTANIPYAVDIAPAGDTAPPATRQSDNSNTVIVTVRY